MKLRRERLTILLNALYEDGIRRLTVSHPSNDVGELVELNLEDPFESEVIVRADRDEYIDRLQEIDRQYGSPAVDDLPNPSSYLNAFFAGDLLSADNENDIIEFLERYGSPDLNAGHRPVFAGFDTNLLPWRIASVLGLRQSGYWGTQPVVNGFALATGVRDELNWDHKHNKSDARQLEEAFGDPFSRLFNQPAGSRREGRLGEIHYRQLRDHQYADEIKTGRGDNEIVAGYDDYQAEGQKDVLLFSNDRNFVERAQNHRILAQHVELPHEIPRKIEASWEQIRDTLFILTILFGVLEIPKTTLYGVWAGKGGQQWRNEAIDVECRSPKIASKIKRNKRIVDIYIKCKE
jgi:hypothetical protein